MTRPSPRRTRQRAIDRRTASTMDQTSAAWRQTRPSAIAMRSVSHGWGENCRTLTVACLNVAERNAS